MSDALSTALRLAAEAADATAGATSGAAQVAARLTSVALRAGSIFAKEGKDPVIEITRILSRQGPVERVDDKWDRFIEANFPDDTAAPPPRHSTDPGMPAFTDFDDSDDPYDGQE